MIVWKVKTSRDGGVVGDDNVFGRDSSFGVMKGGWDKRGLSGAFHGAIFEDCDVGWNLCGYLFGIGGACGT